MTRIGDLLYSTESGRAEAVTDEAISGDWYETESWVYPVATYGEHWIWDDERTAIGLVTNISISNTVSHPAHYAHPSGIEVIDITKHETFLRGNIIKYVLRAPYKGSELEDLQKAAQYLQWEIERIEGETNAV